MKIYNKKDVTTNARTKSSRSTKCETRTGSGASPVAQTARFELAGDCSLTDFECAPANTLYRKNPDFETAYRKLKTTKNAVKSRAYGSKAL